MHAALFCHDRLQFPFKNEARSANWLGFSSSDNGLANGLLDGALDLPGRSVDPVPVHVFFSTISIRITGDASAI